jgi:hypothetical protein
VSVRNRTLTVWRVSTGGWFIVDQVIGRHDNIPYALALEADGGVRGIEILEYRSPMGARSAIPCGERNSSVSATAHSLR